LTAVNAISFQVRSGGIFGLLGPNGAGKSTAIKMLTTLLEPSSGTAEVAGFDIIKSPTEVRKRIGYVPQMLSADGSLTAIENLTLSARLHGMTGAERKARIQEALAFAGLDEVSKKLVKTFSGGMIRRLELAQAMLHHPAVLFLDEPTIGLDPVARKAVWERLQALRHDYGMTILMTTHDMEEADYLCDELAILHQGSMGVTGSPRELKNSVGPNATLDDVFVAYSGGTIHESGSYREIRQARRTLQRLG
ncbi:MAG: ATP-binding cassette domain-containing protein, partial [Gallionella sp.]